jgi:hypothetical protein
LTRDTGGRDASGWNDGAGDRIDLSGARHRIGGGGLVAAARVLDRVCSETM